MARVIVIAPGRGSYNRTELNYLNRFGDHPRSRIRLELGEIADRLRQEAGQVSVSELDGAQAYRPGLHLPGENASALILTCAAADYNLIAGEHRVVATLGNSMGWYIALYTSGALSFEDTFRLVNTMGGHQKDNIQGGQVIIPIVDEAWRFDPDLMAEIEATVERIRHRGPDFWVGHSIRLGGYRVLAGTSSAVKSLLIELPKVTIGSTQYPFQLARHAAFHTPLMREASRHGLTQLSNLDWHQPRIPMIDGRGHIWKPRQYHRDDLVRYTLDTQVVEPFDFTAAVRCAIREYNPDHLVLLGPGETLGGAIAQVMIHEGWRGIRSKRDFVEAQKSDHPPLIAMNRPDQAARII